MTQGENKARWQEERRSVRNYGRAELPNVTPEQIRELRGEGVDWSDIASRFGRSETTLRGIMKGKRKKSGRKVRRG